ncbi:GHKL domain-containing protein [Enterococcus sp. 2201sp1_2201st1_B8_2201SCRN_220225]|uniref:GHKL domain-containing protein n=1 Tax=unclassified Enterococcus TaxID=2608891 RepID=UPI0034A0EFCC
MNLKNNLINKKLKSQLRWLLLFLIIGTFLTIVGFFCYAFTHPFTKNQMAEIKETWLYSSREDPDTTFKSQYVKKMTSIEPNETLVMSRTMVRKVDNPVLLVQGNHQWFSIWLEDELIYDYSPTSQGQTVPENPGKNLQEILLPNDYIGQQLRIEVSTPYENYTGLPVRVFVGEANSVMAYAMAVFASQMLMVILSLGISIALMAFIIRKLFTQKQLDLKILLLACFALTVAVESAATDIISGLFFSPVVNSLLATFFAILTPLLLVSYYYLEMDKLKARYRIWVIIHIVSSALVLSYSLFSKTDLPEVKPWLDTISVFGTIITAYAAIRESQNKNRFYLFCTPWIVLVASAHCFLYIMSSLGTEFSTLNITALFYGAILLVLFSYAVTDFLQKEEKNRRQMSFLEVKTELLEESREEMRQHLSEVDAMKQTFADNLHVMALLAEDENFEGVKEHIQKLQKDTELLDGLPVVTCHPLANLILTRYQKIAQERNIDVELAVDLPESLSMTDNDLTNLFAHLLEHAVRETYAITDPSQRKIVLTISYEKEQLEISCEHTNNYHENIFDKGITAELPEQEEFDLRVLESISKKYAGKVTQQNTDKTDTVKIHLEI